MHTRYKALALMLFFLGMALTIRAQDAPYLLKQEFYKVALSSVKFSPDASRLLTGSSDGSWRIMDPETFRVLLEVPGAHFKAVNAMDMSPKMDMILSAGQNSIKLWDSDGNHLADFQKHATTVWNAAFSPDGKWVVSSAHNKAFLLWDVSNRKLAETLRGHEDICLTVAFSPDTQWIASASYDLSLKIWDLNTRSIISTLPGPTDAVYDLEFSPDSRLLAACSKDRSTRIYDVAGNRLLHNLKGHQDQVMEAEFSPDGNYLLTASADWSVILWDVRSGEKIHQFPDHKAAVMDLEFHPDGGSFYSISLAGDLTRWDLDPEIFVLKYFEQPYLEELSGDPVFEPRRKGESKKEFAARQAQAKGKKEAIVRRYYLQYLEERDR